MPPKTIPPKHESGAPQELKAEDFDRIRDAVLETPRGRWFLNEFATRLRAAEAAGLISSMKRLETAVAANHDALMTRLADALKRGPSQAPSAPQPELAPKHMKFYRQDEEIFTPAPHATIAAVPEPAAEELPRKEERRRPARVIKRQGPAFDMPPEAEAAPPLPEVPAFAPPPLPEAPPAAQPQVSAKRRIVIIRHKPGEEIDVPLAEELARAS